MEVRLRPLFFPYMSLLNAALAMTVLLLISLSMLAEMVNVLPRCVKLSTEFRSCPFTEILGWIGSFPGACWHIASLCLLGGDGQAVTVAGRCTAVHFKLHIMLFGCRTESTVV